MTELALTNLFLNVSSLIWSCSRQDARVSEAGLEQGDDHKDKEASSNNRYAAGQVFDQEGTAVIWSSHTQREDDHRDTLSISKAGKGSGGRQALSQQLSLLFSPTRGSILINIQCL